MFVTLLHHGTWPPSVASQKGLRHVICCMASIDVMQRAGGCVHPGLCRDPLVQNAQSIFSDGYQSARSKHRPIDNPTAPEEDKKD
jgi:hypothetical protein